MRLDGGSGPLDGGEEARLRGRVRDLLASAIFEPRVDGWMTGHDPEFTRELARAGWVGMAVPKEHGGGGSTPLQRHIVNEELLAAGAPLAAHWFADRQVAPALLRHGTVEQRATYLPAICRGEMFFAIGLSEHEAGSDLASVRTRGERVPGGWLVTGTKTWTSWAHRAHAVLVLVRTSEEPDKHGGLTQMILDLPAEGVQVTPIRSGGGEHHFNEVLLDGVFVPDSRVLGTVGEAWQQARAELRFERSGPERFLSLQPLLEEFNRQATTPPARRDVGHLVSRLWCLRQLAAGLAQELTVTGDLSEPAVSIVKDLGTDYERHGLEVMTAEIASGFAGYDESPQQSLLAQAIRISPGITLRGGSTEVLRSVIARESLR